MGGSHPTRWKPWRKRQTSQEEKILHTDYLWIKDETLACVSILPVFLAECLCCMFPTQIQPTTDLGDLRITYREEVHRSYAKLNHRMYKGFQHLHILTSSVCSKPVPFMCQLPLVSFLEIPNIQCPVVPITVSFQGASWPWQWCCSWAEWTPAHLDRAGRLGWFSSP